MKQANLSFYVMEIQHQAAMARVGAATANAALHDLAAGSSVQVFAGAQAILTAGALVSRLLWPDTHRDWSLDRVRFAKDRADELRRIIKPAPILQRHHRTVRNAVEHFDERLDQTFFDETDLVLLDRNISPKAAMLVAENGVYLRHYDPETNTYSVLASEISIQALVDALEAAEANATEWLHRYRTTQIGQIRDDSFLAMDDLDAIAQPRCPDCDVVMRTAPHAFVCTHCGHLQPLDEVEMPPAFDGPDIDGQRRT